jgi:hypothetical protein
MYATQTKASDMMLAMLGMISLLIGVMPKAVIAQHELPGEAIQQRVSVDCPGLQRLTYASPSSRAPEAAAEQGMPEEIHTLLQSRPQEPVEGKLQVPAALLRALLTQEGSRHALELQVPEALLSILSTEGLEQIP